MVSRDTRASRASRETHAAANTWSSHSGMTSRANRTSRVTTRDGHRDSLGKPDPEEANTRHGSKSGTTRGQFISKG
jgi:hypothetical protein